MRFDLAGKRALVTGAGSGIGAAIAETLAGAGSRVFVTDINLAAANETTNRILAAGGVAESHELDVTDESQCARAARTTGPLEILVNNACVGHVGTALTTTSATGTLSNSAEVTRATNERPEVTSDVACQAPCVA